MNTALALRAYKSFTPLYCVRNRWADRYKVVQLPLFPGYVFCQFDSSELYSVLQTPGVLDVVRTGRAPAPIDEREIHALQRFAASGADAEPWPSLVIGQPAMIISGPLAGLTGIVVEHKDGFRVVLSITLLHRSVLVKIARECVTVVSQDQGAGADRPACAACC